MSEPSRARYQNTLGSLIFLSRWLQAPLYVGLIVAQGRLCLSLPGRTHPPADRGGTHRRKANHAHRSWADRQPSDHGHCWRIRDVCPRLRLEGHPAEPEWLSAVNAGVLKVKLATALIGISSIHLLKTFIGIGLPGVTEQAVFWQVVVHLTFVASALLLAWTDRVSSVTAAAARTKGH